VLRSCRELHQGARDPGLGEPLMTIEQGGAGESAQATNDHPPREGALETVGAVAQPPPLSESGEHGPMEIEPLTPPSLPFEELDDLRQYLERILSLAIPSLERYTVKGWRGFRHAFNVEKKNEFSMTSTATCVAFLTRTGRWRSRNASWVDTASTLVDDMIKSDWQSADLDPGNPFTTAFLLEAIYDFTEFADVTLDVDQQRIVDEHLDGLEEALKAGKGIAIEPYPPTAFMTQKAIRVVARRRRDPEVFKGAQEFAWARLREESIACAVNEPDADVFDLGYAAIVASQTTPWFEMTPRERDALAHAIDQFFEAQRPDGAWPRSQPLFHYREYGNAYCYDYEFLVQLLSDPQLQQLLHGKIDYLAKAARALDRLRIPLGDTRQLGWPSGHLKRKKPEPESWSTASVFHFCHQLHRLLAESLRRVLFGYVGARYVASPGRTGEPKIDRKQFLDSKFILHPDENARSLCEVLETTFLQPLVKALPALRQGQRLPDETPTSAILFGPPGTSKTQLARIIATILGWPLLKLDPSHLTRKGLDDLLAEANKIFVMLEAAEEVVVLMDEFDELVREREDSEPASRFLTTAMLPKLAALSERRRLVYLLATNHVEVFDPAIGREGRFDMILPVYPPTLAAKLERWPEVAERMRVLDMVNAGEHNESLRSDLGDLTYSEFARISKKLAEASSEEQFAKVVTSAHEGCILGQHVARRVEAADAQTWKQRLEDQRIRTRVWEGV
jgi:ATPase family associated with various cellular activities (AAA)